MSKRPAMTVVELLAILAVVLLLVVVFVLMWPYMRNRPSWQTTCAANLSSLGKGFYTYGNENAEMWPIAPHAPAETDGVGLVNYTPKKIGVHRGTAGDPNAGQTTLADTEMSTTRNLWLLIRTGASTPASFVCPNSDDSKNEEDNPQLFWDFRNWSEVSYSYQVPYGKKGQPSSDCDSRMVLAADKGPYGAALEAGKANPGIPNLTSSSNPDAWQPWNSPNHAGEGQVMLFADSHAEFFLRPFAGKEADNIYTRWSSATGGSKSDETPRVQGTPPTGNETPWGQTDTLLYP